MFCSVSGNQRTDLCLVALLCNMHKPVALQNEWKMTCIYLSSSTNCCSWKATRKTWLWLCWFNVHPLLTTSTAVVFVIMEKAFHSDMEGCIFQGCCSFNLQVGVVRKAVLLQEGFSVKVFLTNSSVDFPLLIILSRAGVWIIFQFQVWFPLLLEF